MVLLYSCWDCKFSTRLFKIHNIGLSLLVITIGFVWNDMKHVWVNRKSQSNREGERYRQFEMWLNIAEYSLELVKLWIVFAGWMLHKILKLVMYHYFAKRKHVLWKNWLSCSQLYFLAASLPLLLFVFFWIWADCSWFPKYGFL